MIRVKNKKKKKKKKYIRTNIKFNKNNYFEKEPMGIFFLREI